jgi:hypothetical protein
MIFMTRYFSSLRHTHRIVSVSQNFLKIFRFALIAIMAFIAGSCQKEVLKLGSDILPSGDFVSIKSTDTLSVFSYTMLDDSIRTDNATYSFLGQLYDPYFGTSSAGFVTQIRLSRAWDSASFTVDSMKLYMQLVGNKGKNTDVSHTFSIYEISDQIYNDSAYYSSTPLNLTGFKVTGIPIPKLRTDTAYNDIEIKLPENGVTLGNYIVRDASKLFYSNVKPDFRSYFKGLYFQMDPSPDPLLLTLSLVWDQTTYYNYFVLFGHDGAGTFANYSFILDAKSVNAHYNRFTHDYTTATLGDKMAHRNTTYRDDLSYLQGLNGVYTKVSLPGLAKLKNEASLGKIAVNKARLIVPFIFDKTASNFYFNSLPQKLYLRYKAKSGIRYDITDYLMASTTLDLSHNFFDGKIDTVANVYNFNIPAFVQAYLDDATNQVEPEMEIYQSSGIRNVVFAANKNKTPVKFELTYTRF